ncbi:MAG: bifunctional oligoribonuclease/PAP phosphatase NrnA [Candidatus Moranbacteria bacterium]|nr:bifunctional oligoribonuclease/PAP phosphatase NrnA [Candidatus Moranbacteria bacterium]
MKNRFIAEFRNLKYIVENADSVLLVAHTRPDPDTIGANVALKEYLMDLGKRADIVCFDPFPDYLRSLFVHEFHAPDQVDWGSYQAIIASDSVNRGFDRMMKQYVTDKHATVLIDHHPDIDTMGDVVMIDASYSSTCEILFNYFESSHIPITSRMATALLTGISGDTGSFQHSCTTPRVMEIASILMKRGAPLSKISDSVFTNKKISTLKLWGRAFAKAKINQRNGMIVSALTQQDIAECEASTNDVNQVATILNTVPGTKFSLVFFQLNDTTVKGSLRSEEGKGVDVSSIAHQFGGAGHRLASGFEMAGRIQETQEGWMVV